MWIYKSKLAGVALVFVFVCFVFADCTKEPVEEYQATEEAVIFSEESAQDARVDEGITAVGDPAKAEIISPPEEKPLAEAGAPDSPTSATETVSVASQPAKEPVQEPVPVLAPRKYSVTGPDGATYTGYEPMFIICKCSERFSSGALWQAHRDYYSAYRCSCGKNLVSIGEWEAHTGIYDANSYTYTGKTRAEASAEGHTLVNENSYDAEYNLHNGWRT